MFYKETFCTINIFDTRKTIIKGGTKECAARKIVITQFITYQYKKSRTTF